jgi:hypothetical protein
MGRYVIAAVVGCLYLAGSVSVVRNEGQRYRMGLSKTKRKTAEIEEAPFPSTTQKQVASTAIAETVKIATPRPEPVKSVAVAEAAPASKPATVTNSLPKPAAENSLAERKPPEAANVEPSKTAGRNGGPAEVARARILADNPFAETPFWDRPELRKSWDVASLKPQDEKDLGATFHSVLLQLGLIDEESPLLSRVEEAGDSFLKYRRRPEIRYKYFVLKSDAVNAFSVPGGYVYVSRGLFDLIAEEEDYALQFAVGHEMAHVDLRHGITCLSDPDVKKIPFGTVQKLFWLIIPYGYLLSDKVDQEFEADQWVLTGMQRLQRSRREILIFLKKLEGYSKKNGFENGRVKPQAGQGISLLENHYRSQTAARKRLKHLTELIDQDPNAPK